ncbi:GNAT family N-acetyltransferase [Streptomyces sp. SL13]|jgi:GNAT superfamily N-acetyltransferase|uniref:GNAT family N-acetyltransferase n=1 Tax=Streptantibioticus silvisoli TaxID=2705255 RepID=A0AA90JYS9_9ACTN|nr:GNAT family N-acetyltransferase [Streptantibioticus silvisoli]MDI5965657.1 GNAT family N-acetyltransferase [Streptantibioticus silvisoli]MDI5971546.1 GNAT family N-acetyltransferase [Streptantibioticus silvisoli]
MTPPTRIREVREGDWDAIVALEAAAYEPLGLSEERAALESKVRASPRTCFALDLGQRLAGYLLALPYPESRYPELGGPEETAFTSANLHLHDCVVAADLRGRGLAGHLLRHLLSTARTHGYRSVSLVAVAGTETFWAANGFTGHREIALSEGYGANSAYMSMTVPADPSGHPKPTGASPRGSSPQDGVG